MIVEKIKDKISNKNVAKMMILYYDISIAFDNLSLPFYELNIPVVTSNILTDNYDYAEQLVRKMQ